jgi:acetyl esterase/lipase
VEPAPGGNLAAGVAQRLRDEGGIQPESLVLAHPVAHPVAHDPVPRGSDEHRATMAKLPEAMRFSADSTAHVNRNFLGPSALRSLAGVAEFLDIS